MVQTIPLLEQAGQKIRAVANPTLVEGQLLDVSLTIHFTEWLGNDSQYMDEMETQQMYMMMSVR